MTRFWYFLKSLRYQFRNWKIRFYRRYIYKCHILDLRCTQIDYDGGWCDRDYLMLAACFELLRKVVEEERILEGVAWDNNDKNVRIHKEIKALYDWWMGGRAEEHKQLQSSHNGLCPTFVFDHRDDEMLMRLMKVRSYLWV